MRVRKNSRKVKMKLCLGGEVVFQEEKWYIGHSGQREKVGSKKTPVK